MHTIEVRLLALFESESDELFRHCYYRILDRERAMVLMGSAFKRLWQYAEEERHEDVLRGLLYRIANDLIQRERRALRRSEIAPEPLPAAVRTERQREKLFLRMLRELEEPVRDAFVLHRVDALAMERVAELLQEPVSVVAERVRSGTERMEVLLRPYS